MNQKDIMMGVVSLNSHVRYYVYDKTLSDLETMYLIDMDSTIFAWNMQYKIFEYAYTDFKEDGKVDWHISLN